MHAWRGTGKQPLTHLQRVSAPGVSQAALQGLRGASSAYDGEINASANSFLLQSSQAWPPLALLFKETFPTTAWRALGANLEGFELLGLSARLSNDDRSKSMVSPGTASNYICTMAVL